jgi:WD40 repeat protein
VELPTFPQSIVESAAVVMERQSTRVCGAADAGVSPRIDPAVEDSSWCDQPPLPTVPGYQVVRQLKRGGQGVVYQAVQQSTKRKVAIKILLGGASAAASVRKRFEREVELIAGLKHPNVIAVFDSGRTTEGHPYYVMDYVRGVPITQYVREQRLDVRRCLKLFATACDGVNHAHQKGVIHRDLKPSNILVDADGNARVLDFGLAKALAEPVEANVSATGVVVGTLQYMSPEQTRGNPDGVDTRTDVYSLGVILYEMLTGAYPYALDCDIAGVIRNISEAPPAPLSRRWSKEHGVCPTPSRVQRSVHCPIASDVDTIVQKALSKERDRRYDSAGELARDIRRYLDDEPIVARRASAWYQLARLAKRNKVLVGGVAGVVAAVVVGAILTAWQAMRANEQRGRAEHLAVQALQLETLAKQRLVTGLLLWGDSVSAAGDPVAAWRSYMLAWDQASWVGAPATPILAGAVEVTLGERPLGGFYGRDGGVGGFVGHTKGIRGVVISADGCRAFTGSEDGTVVQWDLTTGTALGRYEGHGSGAHGPALSPDGSSVLVGYDDGTMTLWDVNSRQEVRRLKGHSRAAPATAIGVWAVAYSPDGRMALSASDDHTVKLWNLASGECVRTLSGHRGPVAAVAFLRDGRRAVSASHDGTLKLWNLERGTVLRTFEGHTDAVNSLALLPADEGAVSGGFDGTIRGWDLETARETFKLTGHAGIVWRVALAADGKTLASAGEDQSVRLWDLARREQVGQFAGQFGDGMGVAISPDARTVVASGAGPGLRVWGVDPALGKIAPSAVGRRITCIATSVPEHGERMIAFGTTDGTLVLWDAATKRVLKSYPGTGAPTLAVYLAADSTAVAAVAADGSATRWGVASGERLATSQYAGGAVSCAAFAGDGRSVFSASDGRADAIDVWDFNTGKVLRTLRWKAEPVTSLAVSHDGRIALAGFGSGTVRLWDPLHPDADEIRSFSAHPGRVTGVAFVPAAGMYLSAGDDGVVKLWGSTSGSKPRTFAGHRGSVHALGASADGMCVASGGDDQNLCLWDFGRVAKEREFERTVPGACQALSRDPGSSKALATLGDWYAFRGKDEWAVSCLEQARQQGAEVSSLSLARCYWRLAAGCPSVRIRNAGSPQTTPVARDGREQASRQQLLNSALRELGNARQRGEATTLYLDLCTAALSDAAKSE